MIWSQRQRKPVDFKFTRLGEKFLVKLYVDGEFVSNGLGISKKDASQLAAKEACAILAIK